MIAGYVAQQQEEEALKHFDTMQDVLSACASQAALPEGKWIHWNIVLHAFDTNIFVVNALVNMYGKCGSLEDAWILFEGMPERNSVSWTTMIAAYTHCGYNRLAIQLFMTKCLMPSSCMMPFGLWKMWLCVM